jgi:hypothetical protein
MHQLDLFLLFTQPLDHAGLQYMVSGSVASMIYGEPRLTNDIDIVLHLDARAAATIPLMFPAEAFYSPPEEVMVIESRRGRRGHFNLIHHDSGHKADIYLAGDDPLHTWGFSKRRRIALAEDRSLWVAPPEYVILRKLEYFKEGGSEKHRNDIRGMLDVSGDTLDMAALAQWVSRLGLSSLWEDLTRSDRTRVQTKSLTRATGER